eukprot:Gb_38857 [translate_table: standard]
MTFLYLSTGGNHSIGVTKGGRPHLEGLHVFLQGLKAKRPHWIAFYNFYKFWTCCGIIIDMSFATGHRRRRANGHGDHKSPLSLLFKQCEAFKKGGRLEESSP